MSTLSIVIVSWNTRELLRACLESVRRDLAAAPVATEVFVVDNDSHDGSAEMVAQAFPDICLIQSGSNLGFARANNLALRQASGRYWLLLNSDTLVPECTLAALVAAMEAHPETAVGAPLLLNADGTVQHNWARFPDLQSELSGDLDRSQSPYPLTAFDSPTERARLNSFVCDWVGGACFCVRASATVAAGLLDEAFFMYSEETEWCHRLHQRTGGVTRLFPQLTVTHLGGASSQAVPRATRERIWRSRLRFHRLTKGALGSLLPSLVATGRYLLSPLRRAA